MEKITKPPPSTLDHPNHPSPIENTILPSPCLTPTDSPRWSTPRREHPVPISEVPIAQTRSPQFSRDSSPISTRIPLGHVRHSSLDTSPTKAPSTSRDASPSLASRSATPRADSTDRKKRNPDASDGRKKKSPSLSEAKKVTSTLFPKIGIKSKSMKARPDDSPQKRRTEDLKVTKGPIFASAPLPTVPSLSSSSLPVLTSPCPVPKSTSPGDSEKLLAEGLEAERRLEELLEMYTKIDEPTDNITDLSNKSPTDSKSGPRLQELLTNLSNDSPRGLFDNADDEFENLLLKAASASQT